MFNVGSCEKIAGKALLDFYLENKATRPDYCVNSKHNHEVT